MASFQENLIITAEALDVVAPQITEAIPVGAESNLMASICHWLRHCATANASAQDVREELIALFAIVLVSISKAEHDGAICETCINSMATDLGIAIGHTAGMMTGKDGKETPPNTTGSLY